MKVLASAPGRAGILGNPTDGYGGAVMSCSLAERASVTLAGSDVLRATVHLAPGRAASPSVLPPASSDKNITSGIARNLVRCPFNLP